MAAILIVGFGNPGIVAAIVVCTWIEGTYWDKNQT